MPLIPGAITIGASTTASIKLTSAAATGGTAPYTYQWKRATSRTGTYSDISGATSLTLTDTGRTANTVYFFKLAITDSTAVTPETAESGIVAVSTLKAPPKGLQGMRRKVVRRGR